MQVLLLLWIAGVQFSTNFIKVTLQQDFSFTCPSAWTDGAVENLQCVIPQAKFSAKPGGLCDIYTDAVVFQLSKADGTKTTMCIVIGFDTACDGSANTDGCGCREISGGNIVIDYNITAVKADHEGARWECEPQCYDAAGILSVLSPPNTTECFNTIFVSPPTPDPARPSADPSISCKGTQGQYVPENADLDCYCSASDLGQPKGRLRVYRDSVLTVSGSYGNGNETFTIQGVTRRDNGVVFKCVLDWTTPDGQDRDTSYTVHVAYGPDTVSISNPGAFDLHPTSPSPLTLTCSASQSNPGVTYSWSGACARSTSSTCSFTPTTSNNNDVITCTVTNSVTGTGPSPASRTLRIHYPPTSPPVITGYGGEPLCQGATRDITCTVTGGNPPVAAVTFTCGGQGQEVSGTSRTITVTADRSNHGSTCTCRARWKTYNPGWYTQTADVTLTVFSVTVAGKPGASSNGLSTAAAVGVMAAVMTVGVAATVIWMWRRQWILPCASNADSGESRGTPDEHHRPTPAGVLETGGQEDISLYDEIQHSSVQGDPPVPSGYEHLKMQDVGMRSVYSGLRPYPNRARC